MVAGMASRSTSRPDGCGSVEKRHIIGTWKVTANDWTNSEEESNRNDHEMGQTLSVRSDGTASFRGESFNWSLLWSADAVGQISRNIRVVTCCIRSEEISSFVRLHV